MNAMRYVSSDLLGVNQRVNAAEDHLLKAFLWIGSHVLFPHLPLILLRRNLCPRPQNFHLSFIG